MNSLKNRDKEYHHLNPKTLTFKAWGEEEKPAKKIEKQCPVLKDKDLREEIGTDLIKLADESKR